MCNPSTWLLLLASATVYGLELELLIHYPENDSAVELCGFSFGVSTSLSTDHSEEAAVPAEHHAANLFRATVQLPDSDLDKEAVIGIMASFDSARTRDPACMAVCRDISPQGKVVQLGAFKRTGALREQQQVEVWPSFCRTEGTTFTAPLRSAALNRTGKVHFRLPAALSENPLPRPTAEMPAIIYRLNSEWYWPDELEINKFWQELMTNGQMQTIVIAELRFDGVDHDSWDNQPIFTTEDLRANCGMCDSELQFICSAWEASSYDSYVGDNHNYGSASPFFKELYENTMPMVLQQLPTRRDDGILRVGVWGYCIGGLGAWSALTSHPELYNIGYLGSPAVDFNCGDAFHNVRAVAPRAGKPTPKIYIDCGEAEGDLMNNQTLLLFGKLQSLGLVKGLDVFYERAPFGTHQGNSLYRRSTAGLLALFGTDGKERLQKATSQSITLFSATDTSWQSSPVALLSALVVAFGAGRLSAWGAYKSREQPLLG